MIDAPTLFRLFSAADKVRLSGDKGGAGQAFQVWCQATQGVSVEGAFALQRAAAEIQGLASYGLRSTMTELGVPYAASVLADFVNCLDRSWFQGTWKGVRAVWCGYGTNSAHWHPSNLGLTWELIVSPDTQHVCFLVDQEICYVFRKDHQVPPLPWYDALK